MRHLVATLLLALPTAAAAGTCSITIAETAETVVIEVGAVKEQAWKVGRTPVRVTAAQARLPDGHWMFELMVEKAKDDGWELLTHPKLVTGAGVDAVLETSTRLGPLKIVCRT